jgi:hypothetical protein
MGVGDAKTTFWPPGKGLPGGLFLPGFLGGRPIVIFASQRLTEAILHPLERDKSDSKAEVRGSAFFVSFHKRRRSYG